MKEAMFYKKLENDVVQCNLCPHNCTLKPGERGKCGVRENIDGKLISLCYGKTISASIDPIEKKPLFHFLPGTKTFSVATVGCNLSCGFCQNFSISQSHKKDLVIPGDDLSPEEIVEEAIKAKCKSISYTYTEPTIYYEYAYETAKIAKAKGIANVFITNGFINPEPLKKIIPYLDAVNVDLKSFTDESYRSVLDGMLQPVLDTIKLCHDRGIWVEITTLVVPGLNDNMLDDIARFIASIDKKIPWHISRFFPTYKFNNVPQTPVDTIMKAIEIGKKHGLKYVYAGNIWGKDLESTYCPNCNKKIIRRNGFHNQEYYLDEDMCKFCGEMIDIIRKI